MKTFEFSRAGLEKAIKHKNHNRKYLLLTVNLILTGAVLYNPSVVAFNPNSVIDSVVAFKMTGF